MCSFGLIWCNHEPSGLESHHHRRHRAFGCRHMGHLARRGPMMSGPDGPEEREAELEERLNRDWLRIDREEQAADEARDDNEVHHGN